MTLRRGFFRTATTLAILFLTVVSAQAARKARTDTTAPTVSITSPASGTVYTTEQTVTITASASDNVGVSYVQFYDGGTWVGTATAWPYTYPWAITSAANASHSWSATAYDAAGNAGTSAIVNLTVNIGGGGGGGTTWPSRFRQINGQHAPPRPTPRTPHPSSSRGA